MIRHAGDVVKTANYFRYIDIVIGPAGNALTEKFIMNLPLLIWRLLFVCYFPR